MTLAHRHSSYACFLLGCVGRVPVMASRACGQAGIQSAGACPGLQRLTGRARFGRLSGGGR